MPLILDVLCRSTGMGYAAVARVTQDRWVVCQARDEIDFGLGPGGELVVGTTICREVRDHGRPVVIDHVAEDALFRTHPTPALYGFQSYVSLPIVRRNGAFFGTLCAIDPKPARVNTPEMIGTFRVFAELIALHLDADDRLAAAEETRLLNDRLEARLAERSAALRLYEDIVQSDNAPICAFDRAYRLIAFNPAHSEHFFRIYGHRVRIGDVFPDLFLPEQAAVIRGFMARALAGEAFTVTEAFGDPALARPVWEVAYNPLRDEAGKVVGAFHHAIDVSARMRTEAELARAQEALRQSQKMEAVGQLTGGLAHDSNNLLTGITGSLEMMSARIAQGRFGDLARYVGAAQGAAKRAAALTHRLLAFSRRQTLAPKPTDVTRLVAGMQELVERTMGPEIAVDASAASASWPVLVDPSQLENALLNLCINARDAMPDGGRLAIATADLAVDAASAAAAGLRPGDYVSLSVSDTGIGMPDAVIERALDPLFTTKPIGQGTGLGLSMVYGFVRQSDGRVRIASEVGRGTEVCLTFPRHAGDAAVPDVASTAAVPTAPAGQGETVLVVDDEPTVRMLVVEVLGELGYRALEARDGATALRVLQSDARIDLLVTPPARRSPTQPRHLGRSPGFINEDQALPGASAARPLADHHLHRRAADHRDDRSHAA